MKCPKCGERFYQKKGRDKADFDDWSTFKPLLLWADIVTKEHPESAGYARLRECRACGHSAKTVELTEGDLPHLLRGVEPDISVRPQVRQRSMDVTATVLHRICGWPAAEVARAVGWGGTVEGLEKVTNLYMFWSHNEDRCP